jgi:protoheme IX farnesyltransferase
VNRLKDYYNLTKPGIIYGNLLTASGGFLLAARDHIDLTLLLFTLLGTSLIIASACVFNNYIDRNIDSRMARTKNRALVSGLIRPVNALIFGLILGVIGVAILTIYTNLFVVFIGISAFLIYVVLYGMVKRRSIHGTLVGTAPGAASMVAGYCAVSNNINTAAVILFIIMVTWQMAHFYAIAISRLDDYKSAGIPVLPAVKGIRNTEIQMLAYIGIFIVATLCLTFFGYTGYVFAAVMLLLGLWWMYLSSRSFNSRNHQQSARKLFLFSLIIIIALSFMLSVNALIT